MTGRIQNRLGTRMRALGVGLGLSISSLMGLAWMVIPHPIIPIALGIGPIAAAVAFTRPILPVALFVVFSHFRIHEVFPPLMPLRLPLLLAAGSLAAVGLAIALKRLQPRWDPLFLPFAVFFGVVTVGVFLGSNFGNSFGYWKDTYVKIAIMVFSIAWLVRGEQDFRFILRAILSAAVIVSLMALYNKANGIDLVEGTRVSIGRSIGSVLGDPNDLALVLMFGAGLALAAAETARLGRFDRLLGASCFILVILAIVATQSRGGLLGIMAVVGVTGLRRIKSKALLAAIGIVCMAVLFAVAGVSDRKSGGAHEEGIDESAMGRIHAWNAAISMAVTHPLTGVGLDNFYNTYYLHSDFWDGKNHAVHSTWFGVLGETGFLGLGLFLWMTIRLYKALRQAGRVVEGRPDIPPILLTTARGLYGGFAGFCVSGTFLTQGFTWPFYLMLALSVPLVFQLKPYAQTRHPS